MVHHSSSRIAETIAILGVGLLGGSLGAALRKRRLVDRVLGVGRSRERLQLAEDLGQIDVGLVSISEAAKTADVIVFCTPVDHIPETVRQAVAAAKKPILMTDVGSTKTHICRELEEFAHGPAVFVGSHPLAGSEKQGCEFADADLFEGRLSIVTPVQNSDGLAVTRVCQLWESVGARIIEVSPEAHDAAVARTSHVPHLVASAIAGALPLKWQQFTARGFRDTTRIAAGDAELWTQILLSNSTEVLAGLGEVERQMTEFRHALETGNAPVLKKLLQEGKHRREAIEELQNQRTN